MEKKEFNKSAFECNAKKIQELLESRNDFFFYFNPDPDSWGVSLAFALYLKKAGKNIIIYFCSDDKGVNLDFLFKIAEFNQVFLISDLNILTQKLKEKEYVFITCDTPTAALLPHTETIFEIYRSYLEKRAIEIDHHFGNDSEQIYPESISLFKESNSCCEILADFFCWMRTQESYPADVDLELCFSRNIVLCLLTGICYDTQLGKFLPYKGEKDWFSFLSGRLKELTWKDSAYFRTASEIYDVITSKSRGKEIVIEKIMKNCISQNGVGLLFFPKVKKNENLIPSSGLFCSLDDVSDDLANLIPEDAGKIGIFVYFDSKKEKYMIKIRRSTLFQQFDLRNLDVLLETLFSDAFCGGGGHSGAVSFRISQELKYDDVEKKVSIFFSQVAEKISSLEQKQ